ncbi:integral membrane protein S linking to the trans Golgi network-domain-containing protein [Pilobolus umbonatus]|nr:integral membrane protein S linking to the trans Golgi network-domain-containing protein [Pilobolus umbonatus]
MPASSFRAFKWDPALIIAQQIRVDTSYGWTLIIVWIATAICSIFLLLFIVQRARQILDYVLTFHLFHLLFVWNSNRHFPTGFTWWILQLINILIMTFGGEWACMNREMRPIKVKGSNDTTNTNNSAEGG